MSRPTLVQILSDLICLDFFQVNAPNSDLRLELHLQCIVAGLRLLAFHHNQPGSGAVPYGLSEKLQRHMSRWESYHVRQNGAIKAAEDPNFNNEFLLVYARDLINSLSSDRTGERSVLTKLFAVSGTLEHDVHPKSSKLMQHGKNIVRSVNSLRTTIPLNSKAAPSSWHSQLRTIDDFCLAVRVLQQCAENEKTSDGDCSDSAKFQEIEEAVLDELSDILRKEFDCYIQKVQGTS